MSLLIKTERIYLTKFKNNDVEKIYDMKNLNDDIFQYAEKSRALNVDNLFAEFF